MSNNNGGPAFPGLHPSKECRYSDEGMTLRDYLAAKAMQSIPTQSSFNMKDNESHAAYVARRSYEIADAMLAERDK